MSTLNWTSMEHRDEQRDQQVDLLGPYWATVGPDARTWPDGWSWSVLDFDLDNTEAASGQVPTEDEAKAAVAEWATASGVMPS